MMDGTVVGIGLFPGHEDGEFAIRCCRDGDVTGVYRVDLPALLGALGGLGVPLDHPSLRP